MNYKADLQLLWVLLFLGSKVASNNFVEVPGFTGTSRLFSAWTFFFFFFKKLLLAQKNLILHWRSKQCHQYLGVIVNLSPSWVSEWVKVAQLCPTLCDPHGLYSPWHSPGQKTGVDSLFLLQEIFPTQELNPGLPHCRWILYQLSHQGSPRILEWVAYPFSRGSFQPMNWTRVSCIAGGFFTNWTIRKLVK